MRDGQSRKLGQHPAPVFGLRLLQKGRPSSDLFFRKVGRKNLVMSVDGVAVFDERDTLMPWNYAA
ncbi:hypothetical protein ASD52_04535 [Ensifer sp. Root142]|nr:hypothetical protein ASD52_04535 [Ensifer sp. Root142]